MNRLDFAKSSAIAAGVLAASNIPKKAVATELTPYTNASAQAALAAICVPNDPNSSVAQAAYFSDFVVRFAGYVGIAAVLKLPQILSKPDWPSIILGLITGSNDPDLKRFYNYMTALGKVTAIAQPLGYYACVIISNQAAGDLTQKWTITADTIPWGTPDTHVPSSC